jgi:hypothetical protein
VTAEAKSTFFHISISIPGLTAAFLSTMPTRPHEIVERRSPGHGGEPGLRVPYGGESVMGREAHHGSHFTTFLRRPIRHFATALRPPPDALVLPFSNGGGLLFSEEGDAPVWPCSQLSLVGEIARRRFYGGTEE